MYREPSSALPSVRVPQMVEDVLRCKWTLSILQLVRSGICRPGAIERTLPGLTTKVMNERLRKLVAFGILARETFPEIPPRVEYHLTDFGRKFIQVLDDIEKLSQLAPSAMLDDARR
jgi:DNA-binding HxlR family transcriptional regulator